ncbi:MAG: STAS domain-containing protein, partial [Syntrophorhabdus sp.]
MDIIEKEIGGVNTIVLGGRLDISTCQELDQRLDALINAGRVCLVISLEGVEYVSSSGLRVLLAYLKEVKKRDGDIKLACVKPSIKEVFDIAGFSTLFSMYDLETVAV